MKIMFKYLLLQIISYLYIVFFVICTFIQSKPSDPFLLTNLIKLESETVLSSNQQFPIEFLFGWPNELFEHFDNKNEACAILIAPKLNIYEINQVFPLFEFIQNQHYSTNLSKSNKIASFEIDLRLFQTYLVQFNPYMEKKFYSHLIPADLIDKNPIQLLVKFKLLNSIDRDRIRILINSNFKPCLQLDSDGFICLGLINCSLDSNFAWLNFQDDLVYLTRHKRETNFNSLSKGALAAIIIVVLVLLIALAVGGYFLYVWLRKKRSRHGLYEPNTMESKSNAYKDSEPQDLIKLPPEERLI